MWNLLHGDVGYSFYNSTSVRSLIWDRVPVTFSLAIGAAILWLLIGVSTGVLAATRPRSPADRVVTVAALFFYSMPGFLLGLIFLYFLFFRLHLAGITIFPGSGYVPLTEDPLQWAQHLLLPWFTIALVTAALYSRLTRGSMLDVLGEDYIRTARAKGLSERRVVYRHGLRSAITPIVTQFGIDLGTLLGGVIIVENIFGLPGLGQLAVQSVTTHDLPVIIGTVVLASAFIVTANILVDICYALLDPRVRVH
jgi:peptide/nickel transport system permease protein